MLLTALDDIPEALAALTVRDVSDIESLDQEKSHGKNNANSDQIEHG